MFGYTHGLGLNVGRGAAAGRIYTALINFADSIAYPKGGATVLAGGLLTYSCATSGRYVQTDVAGASVVSGIGTNVAPIGYLGLHLMPAQTNLRTLPRDHSKATGGYAGTGTTTRDGAQGAAPDGSTTTPTRSVAAAGFTLTKGTTGLSVGKYRASVYQLPSVGSAGVWFYNWDGANVSTYAEPTAVAGAWGRVSGVITIGSVAHSLVIASADNRNLTGFAGPNRGSLTTDLKSDMAMILAGTEVTDYSDGAIAGARLYVPAARANRAIDATGRIRMLLRVSLRGAFGNGAPDYAADGCVWNQNSNYRCMLDRTTGVATVTVNGTPYVTPAGISGSLASSSANWMEILVLAGGGQRTIVKARTDSAPVITLGYSVAPQAALLSATDIDLACAALANQLGNVQRVQFFASDAAALSGVWADMAPELSAIDTGGLFLRLSGSQFAAQTDGAAIASATVNKDGTAATQATVAKQPTVDKSKTRAGFPAAVKFTAANSQSLWMSGPENHVKNSANIQPATIIAVMKPGALQTNGGVISFTNPPSVNPFSVHQITSVVSSAQRANNGGGANIVGTTSITYDGTIHALAWVVNGASSRIHTNGVVEAINAPLAVACDGYAAMTIGSSRDSNVERYYLDGSIYELLVFKGALSQSDTAAAIKALIGVQFDVVFDGNSITAGYLSTAPSVTVAADPTAPMGMNYIYNAGVGGQTTALVGGGEPSNMTDRYPGQVRVRRIAGKRQFYVPLEIGNDLYWSIIKGTPYTARQLVDRYWTLVNLALADGFTVIPCTPAPRKDLWETYGVSSVIDAAAALIRSESAGIVGHSILVDCNADAILRDYNNAAYYNPDGVHPATAGSAQIAALQLAAVKAYNAANP